MITGDFHPSAVREICTNRICKKRASDSWHKLGPTWPVIFPSQFKLDALVSITKCAHDTSPILPCYAQQFIATNSRITATKIFNRVWITSQKSLVKRAPVWIKNNGCGPDNKVHGSNMGPTWVLSAPVGPHGPCYQGWSVSYLHWQSHSPRSCVIPLRAHWWGTTCHFPPLPPQVQVSHASLGNWYWERRNQNCSAAELWEKSADRLTL